MEGHVKAWEGHVKASVSSHSLQSQVQGVLPCVELVESLEHLKELLIFLFILVTQKTCEAILVRWAST